jgi:hypothetical protein
MNEVDRLQQAMLDGLKAKAAAEFWEDAHDRVKDRMLELEAEVDSLRRRLHELGDEADAQWEIVQAFEYPSEAMVDAADRCLRPPDQHRLGVAAALHAAMQAAKQEVANEVR